MGTLPSGEETGAGSQATWDSAPKVPLSTLSNWFFHSLTSDFVSSHSSEGSSQEVRLGLLGLCLGGMG